VRKSSYAEDNALERAQCPGSRPLDLCSDTAPGISAPPATATGARTLSNATSAIDNPESTVGTSANGINDHSHIVGYFDDGIGVHGFLDSDATFTTMDVPGAIGTQAWGMNDNGQIVGQFTDAPGSHGFVVTPTVVPEP